MYFPAAAGCVLAQCLCGSQCSLRTLLPFVYPPAISALNPSEQAQAGSQDGDLSHSIIIVRFDE